MAMFDILPRSTRPPRRDRDDERTMTAKALERLRAQQAAFQQEALREEPIHHPLQGINRLAQAAVGGLMQRKVEHEEATQAEREQKQRAAAMRRLMETMQRQQTPPMAAPAPAAPAGAPGAQEAPAGAQGMDWLFQRESGGDFGAMNEQGYAGRAQFGADRLADAQAAGVIPQGMGPQQLVDDPRVQQEIEQWHFDDIRGFIDERGYDQLVGQEIGGVPVTPEGMLAVAHLGGKEGLARFLETGGQYDPADANGTRLSDYLALGAQHASQAAAPAPAAPAPAPQAAGPDPAALMAALGDPALPPETRQIALLMLDRMQPETPDPVDLGPGHHLVDPRTGQPIYEVPEEPDRSTIARLMDERDALPPGDPRREEYDAAIARAGGGATTNVNVDTAQPYGPLRAGERMVLDEDGNPVRVEPIPGGELEREQEEAAAAEQTAQEQVLETATIVTDAAGEAARLVEENGWLRAGPLGGALAATGLSEVSALIDTVRSNIALDKIVEMKKTGATLGQVSEKEIDLLADSLGKISAYMHPEVLHENLTFISDVYGRIREDLAASMAAEEAPAEGAEEAPAAPEPEAAPPAAARKARRGEGAVEFPAELEGITLGDRSARDIWEQLTPEAREQLMRDLGAL